MYGVSRLGDKGKGNLRFDDLRSAIYLQFEPFCYLCCRRHTILFRQVLRFCLHACTNVCNALINKRIASAGAHGCLHLPALACTCLHLHLLSFARATHGKLLSGHRHSLSIAQLQCRWATVAWRLGNSCSAIGQQLHGDWAIVAVQSGYTHRAIGEYSHQHY